MKNKNVLITGTSKGIGKELALHFLSQGHDVFGIARSETQFHDENYTHITLDLSKPTNFSGGLIELTKLQQVDIVINNAGTLINKPFSELSLQDWQATFQVNVISPAMLLQALYNDGLLKEGSHVVNISSMGGFQGSDKFSGLSAYSSSKGAISILSESLSAEFKEKGISVNALCLGGVETNMYRNAFSTSKEGIPVSKMARFIFDFALNYGKVVNGKILPIALGSPV